MEPPVIHGETTSGTKVIPLETLRREITTQCVRILGPSWDERFGELLAYKEQHGHCDVPSRLKENEKLSRWVSEQRRFFKQNLLAADRAGRLEEIGFKWVSDRSPEDIWEKSFQEYCEHVEKHGRDVPIPSENKRLRGWARNNRKYMNAGKLSDEKQARLKKIGFRLSNRLEYQWDHRFRELTAYKDQFGDCNVPSNWPENPELAAWVSHQRSRKRNATLRSAREASLNEVGFDWNPPKATKYKSPKVPWEETFRRLGEYVDRVGDADVPSLWPEDQQLANWVKRMRSDANRGTLSEERKNKLKSLSFRWENRSGGARKR